MLSSSHCCLSLSSCLSPACGFVSRFVAALKCNPGLCVYLPPFFSFFLPFWLFSLSLSMLATTAWRVPRLEVPLPWPCRANPFCPALNDRPRLPLPGQPQTPGKHAAPLGAFTPANYLPLNQLLTVFALSWLFGMNTLRAEADLSRCKATSWSFYIGG